jgi:microsomal dipeptidase-like Zn-dependent dipeptidase
MNIQNMDNTFLKAFLFIAVVSAMLLSRSDDVHAADGSSDFSVSKEITCKPEELSCPGGTCPPGALWGFADLHAHPASHLAFGADENGEGGPFHGKPGLSVTVESLAIDLPACDALKHAHTLDPILDGLRGQAFNALEGSGHTNHLSSGYPDFHGWPSARSPTHQQMHVQWLWRAYQGGLRLLVASVTDNQLFATLWNRNSTQQLKYDLGDTSSKDEASAKRQLEFIHQFVRANSDWMTIVVTPEQADCAISSGKMAVVLALEMDSLTTQQILSLKSNYGVSLVTPIHLTDHPEFGGMAAYSDIFNSSNRAHRDEFIKVRNDPSLSFRFSAPRKFDELFIPYFGFPLFWPGTSVAQSPESQCDLFYETCDFVSTVLKAGHANALGIRDGAKEKFNRFFDEGLIVDLSHMSQRAHDDVLSLAEAREIPVVETHTGLRPAIPEEYRGDPRHVSERMIHPDHVRRIGALGGIIGLGTTDTERLTTWARRDGFPLAWLDPHAPADDPFETASFRWEPQAPHLRVMLNTGAAGPSSASRVLYELTLGSTVLNGQLQEMHNDKPGNLNLESGSVDWVDIALPVGTKAGQLSQLQLTLDPYCFTKCEIWNLSGLEVFFISQENTALLLRKSGAVKLFSDESRSLNIPLAVEPNEVINIESWSGDDGLRCGAFAEFRLKFSDGTLYSDSMGQRLSPRDGIPDHGYFERPAALPAGKQIDDIVQFGIRHHQGACEVFTTSDNWDLQRIRVAQPMEGADKVLIDRSGSPVFHFTDTNNSVSLPLRMLTEFRRSSSRFVWLVVRTGQDKLENGRQAQATFHFSIGGDRVVQLNEFTEWSDRTTHKILVDLGDVKDLNQLSAIDISVVGTGDDWKINTLELLVPGQPMRNWWLDYEHAYSLLGRPPAIGSDFNGLEIQMSYAEVAPRYPFVPFNHPTGIRLEKQKVGNRTMDFRSEGLSNIGQLPDFIAALGELSPADPTRVAPIYQSAQAFVQMWYTLELHSGSGTP